MQREIGPGKSDGGFRKIDAEDLCPAGGESGEIGADATADLDEPLAAKPAEIDQPGQIGQLVEAVGIELVEERTRAHRLRGHLEIVNACVPVFAHAPG